LARFFFKILYFRGFQSAVAAELHVFSRHLQCSPMNLFKDNTR
jgi:hypothetical protein